MLKARCYRLAPLLFGGNHILVIFAQNICIRNCFFGLKMQKSPCPGRGTPPHRPSPPLGLFAHSQFSSQITFGGFRRHGINFFLLYVQNFHLVLFNSWWIAWKLLWKNCHKSIQNKVDIALQSTEHLESQSLRALDPGRKGLRASRSWCALCAHSLFSGCMLQPPPPPTSKKLPTPLIFEIPKYTFWNL